MFQLNDFILLFVVFCSMAMGILLPRLGAVFEPYPLYLMMSLLFLSFLSIRVSAIRRNIRDQIWTLLWLLFLKLVAVPAGIYYLLKEFCPAYAVAGLLLTGISTGVVAPFISALVNANGSLVLVMVVLTSLFVPFTLPPLVKILVGHAMEISLWGMVRMLGLVVFLPILTVEIVRRFSPRLSGAILKRRFPVSLIIFAVINLGVFSKYSSYFHQRPVTLLQAAGIAVSLSCIYLLIGICALWKSTGEDQLAAAISFGNMNNVLIIVFASEFFGPLEPTLAAVYMIPFFGLILPLRIIKRLRSKQG